LAAMQQAQQRNKGAPPGSTALQDEGGQQQALPQLTDRQFAERARRHDAAAKVKEAIRCKGRLQHQQRSEGADLAAAEAEAALAENEVRELMATVAQQSEALRKTEQHVRELQDTKDDLAGEVAALQQRSTNSEVNHGRLCEEVTQLQGELIHAETAANHAEDRCQTALSEVETLQASVRRQRACQQVAEENRINLEALKAKALSELQRLQQATRADEAMSQAIRHSVAAVNGQVSKEAGHAAAARLRLCSAEDDLHSCVEVSVGSRAQPAMEAAEVDGMDPMPTRTAQEGRRRLAGEVDDRMADPSQILQQECHIRSEGRTGLLV